jgi:Proteolysis_6 C-terminal/Putative zinc finger in N-recognin (UBR box)/E3 ubiquitin-protein ligase UBR1-like, winged-helix domain
MDDDEINFDELANVPNVMAFLQQYLGVLGNNNDSDGEIDDDDSEPSDSSADDDVENSDGEVEADEQAIDVEELAQVDALVAENGRNSDDPMCKQIENRQADIVSLVCDESELDAIEQRMRDKGTLRSSACGKIWQSQALAYKCATCGTDPTVAVCVECFEVERHQGHDFRMIRTGGGCCDCGDLSAWRSTCSAHGGDSGNGNSDAVGDDFDGLCQLLDDDVRERANCALRYVVNALARRHERRSPGEHYQVRAVRSLVQLCRQLCDPMRALVARAFVVPCNGRLLERIMAIDHLRSTTLRAQFTELYFQLLMIAPFKRAFARNFCALYERLASLGAGRATLRSFSVQLLTVPPLVGVVARDGRLLDTMLRLFADSVVAPALKPNEHVQIDESFGDDYKLVDMQSDAASGASYWRLLHDIDYVLQHGDVSRAALAALDNSQALGDMSNVLPRLLYVYASFSGMQPNWRERDEHVLFDTMRWYDAFNALRRINVLRNTAVNSLSAVEHVDSAARPALVAVAEALVPIVRRPVLAQEISLHYPLHRFFASLLSRALRLDSAFDIAPLLATIVDIGQLVVAPLRCLLFVSQVRARLWVLNGHSPLSQADTYRTVGRFRSEMLELDVFLVQFCAAQLQRDGADRFVPLLFDIFELGDDVDMADKKQCSLYASALHIIYMLANERSLVQVVDEQDDEECVGSSSSSSSLQSSPSQSLPLTIVTRARIEREIRHALFLHGKSCTFTELTNTIAKPLSSHADFEPTLRAMTTFVEATSTESGHFSFASDEQAHWAQFDPYFLGYDDAEMQRAIENMRAFRQRANVMPSAAVPLVQPVSTPRAPAMRPLPSLLASAALATRVIKILELRASGVCTDHQLASVALHIVLGALHVGDADAIARYRTAAALDTLLALRYAADEHGGGDYVPLVDAILTRLSKRDADAAQRIAREAKQQRRRLRKQAKQKSRKRQRMKLSQQHVMRQFRERQAAAAAAFAAYDDDNDDDAIDQDNVAKDKDAVDGSLLDLCIADSEKNAAGNDADDDRDNAVDDDDAVCCVCRESMKADRPLCCVALFQRSTLQLAAEVSKSSSSLLPSSSSSSPSEEVLYTAYVGSCGHLIHQDCYQRHFASLLRSSSGASFNMEAGEFSCPACRTLSNAVLPLVSYAERIDAGALDSAVLACHTRLYRTIEANMFADAESLPRQAIFDLWSCAFAHTIRCNELAARHLPQGERFHLSSPTFFLLSALYELLRHALSSELTSMATETTTDTLSDGDSDLETVSSSSSSSSSSSPSVYPLVGLLTDMVNKVPMARERWLRAVVDASPSRASALAFVRQAYALHSAASASAWRDVALDNVGSMLRPMCGVDTLDALVYDGDLPTPALEWCDDGEPVRLIKLPERFQQHLVAERLRDTCTRCGTVPSSPAICMCCGITLCLESPKCCPRELAQHTATCSPTCGLFVALRLASVVVTLSGVGSFVADSVYLDQYGEQDIGLRRGRELGLSLPRLARLHRQLFLHQFHQLSRSFRLHSL